MKIILDKNKLVKFIQSQRNLGFVPTMGAIHQGHSSLIKKSLKQNDKTIVTIFINKPQFNKESDFKKYPRVLKKDIFILKKLGVDCLYLPTVNQIYPYGINKNIKISSFSKKLCGRFRPGHFKAVVDVVDRFIKIIKPKKIYLGEKDMQQLQIIYHFVKKNNIKVKIVGCRTVREKNGIPYSSRNFLLSSKEKNTSSKIYTFLLNKKKLLIKNRSKLNQIKKKILKFGATKVDYIEIIDINKIIKPFKKKNKYKIFIAYYLGTTRLIDNI